MLDRRVPPVIKRINRLHLPLPDQTVLSNGIPVYVTNLGTQEVIKIQIVFEAGRPVETKPLVARATSRLIKEGTANHTSAEIADQLDFFGATLSTSTSLDNANIVFYSLTKHFSALIPLIAEILTQPTFPQAELDIFKENSKRRLQVDLAKNDIVAYRKMTEYIFGSQHPYGYNSDQKAYDLLERVDLLHHFQKNYHAQNCQVFISGKINPNILQLLDQHLGQIPRGKKTGLSIFPVSKEMPQKVQHALPNSLQTAIRIGRRMIGRKHLDYDGFTVLNTILGGYFGSRLMMNIREQKGYTYNIYSVQDTMLHDACFYIATEVGNEFVEAATHEIYKEMKRLQRDLIPEEELEMVRNYLLGNMLHMIDGPFHVSAVIKTLVLENMPFERFNQLVNTINHITAPELRELAQKYLDEADMWEVRIG